MDLKIEYLKQKFPQTDTSFLMSVLESCENNIELATDILNKENLNQFIPINNNLIHNTKTIPTSNSSFNSNNQNKQI